MLISHLRKYSFLGILSLLINFIYTRLVLNKAYLIRRPSYIRIVGKYSIDSGFSAGPGLILDILHDQAELIIGKNVKMNHRCHIGVMKSVKIGDDVLMASNVFISDHSHGCYSEDVHSNPTQAPNERKLFCKDVEIGNKVWIGENACILSGVSIGESSIIGANSVVTRNIPPYSIAAGAPARVVKTWDEKSSRWEKID